MKIKKDFLREKFLKMRFGLKRLIIASRKEMPAIKPKIEPMDLYNFIRHH